MIETILTSGIVAAVVSYLLNTYLEDYKLKILRREKIETFADFFSKWIKYRGREGDYLTEKELFDYYEDLNKASIKMCLYIDDEKLLTEIMKRLQNAPEAKDSRLLIGEVRKFVIGYKRGSGVNYVLGRPIILLKKNNSRARPVSFKI